MGLTVSIIFVFKNFSLPIYLGDQNKIVTPNFLLRQSLSNKYKKNDIYNDILRLSFLNLPKDLLENFYSIGKNVFESRITKNPKVIFL